MSSIFIKNHFAESQNDLFQSLDRPNPQFPSLYLKYRTSFFKEMRKRKKVQFSAVSESKTADVCDTETTNI